MAEDQRKDPEEPAEPARAASLDPADEPDVEEMTPAKMVEYYQRKVRTGEVAPSITGIAARVRKDLEGKSDKSVSDERVNGIVNKILNR